MITTGKNRIMIFGPKTDGTYVVVIVGPQLRIFRTAIEFHRALQQARTLETMSRRDATGRLLVRRDRAQLGTGGRPGWPQGSEEDRRCA